MNRYLFVILTLLMSHLQGEDGELPPWHWSNWDLATFSHERPDTMADRFGNLSRQRPPEEVMDEVLNRLAHNQEFREWLVDLYEETPVTWENYRQRSRPLWVLQHLRAEWSVRFLLELTHDKRPMTSSKYDYESEEFRERLRELAVVAPEQAIDLARTSGFDAAGRNSDLAERNLVVIPFAGAPTQSERQEKKQRMSEWLLAPSQRDRLPEILSETWGEKAVLNAELGLGPDNKPLGEGSGSTSGQSGERRPMAERLGGGEVEVGDKDDGTFILWLPLGGALLVLSAGAVVWLRSRSKAA